MAMKPNLDQGNVAAKRKNMPGPLAKTKRDNLVVGKTMAKAKNSPPPLAKSTRTNLAQTSPVKANPSTDDLRIHRELTTGKRNNSHSRG